MLPAALYRAGPALRVVPVFGYSTKVRTRLGLRCVASLARSSQAARSLTGALSPGGVHLIPSVVPVSVSACSSLVGCMQPSWWTSTIQNLRKSLVRSWEPVCSLVGVPSLGPSLPFPLPPPPASGRGWAGPPPASSSLGSLSPFILQMAATCSGQLIFSLSLAFPQFKLLSHISSL